MRFYTHACVQEGACVYVDVCVYVEVCTHVCMNICGDQRNLVV